MLINSLLLIYVKRWFSLHSKCIPLIDYNKVSVYLHMLTYYLLLVWSEIYSPYARVPEKRSSSGKYCTCFCSISIRYDQFSKKINIYHTVFLRAKMLAHMDTPLCHNICFFCCRLSNFTVMHHFRQMSSNNAGNNAIYL